MNASTSGTTSTSTSSERTAYASRQPTCAMRYCASGANTMPPAEIPAVAMPSALPRRATNQRATAVLFGRAPMHVEPSATGPTRQAYSTGSECTRDSRKKPSAMVQPPNVSTGRAPRRSTIRPTTSPYAAAANCVSE